MPYRKANIPKAIREQVWLATFDKVYEWNEDAYQADNSTGWIKVE